MAIGCWLPWGRYLFITVSGMDGGDGIFFLIAAAGLAYASWARKPTLLIVLAVVALLLWAFEINDIGNRIDESEGAIDYGGGLYLIGAAAAAHLVAGIQLARKRSASR
jgi:hypothetical protein